MYAVRVGIGRQPGGASAQQQRAVAAAEAERVAQRVAHVGASRWRCGSAGRTPGRDRACSRCRAPRRSPSRANVMTASTMPAAPSVWPVQPLVELASVRAGNMLGDELRLDLVVLLARGAVQVDVVDRVRRQRRRARAHASMARRAPRPVRVRRGHVVRVARFAVAEQPRARSPSRSSSAKPPPSPRLIPRARAIERVGRAPATPVPAS